MPNTKAAKKAMRVSLRKRVINTSRKWKIKNSLKDLRKALINDAKNCQIALSNVFSQLDKAVKTNVIHKNKANRKKSRVSLMVAKVLAK
jgi:small subunit ribosomal protein S20